MRKFLILIFLTLWLLWASGPAVTGPVALRYISKSPIQHIMTGFVTGIVIYYELWVSIVWGIARIVDPHMRGP